MHTDRSTGLGEPILISRLDGHDSTASPFLAADVGGTHARIGLVVPHAATGRPDLVAYQTYRCAEYGSFTGILGDFCRDHAIHPETLVLACAGFVDRGVVVNENLAWPIRLD